MGAKASFAGVEYGGAGVAYLRWAVGALAALGLGGTALAQPQPAPQPSPPPLEAYGRLPTVTSLSLSPSGERLASVGDVNGKRVVLVRTLTGTVLFASPVGNEKVRSIDWVDDDHVLVTVSGTGSFDQIKSILNGVSLAVAAIAVFIVTYIDLVNRRRTIGIERAIGISGPAITISYVLKAIVFGILGVIGGAALFFGVAIPWVRHHPFMFSIGPVTLSPTSGELRNDAVILVVVACVGALVPAWRTVRTHLLEAIGN